MNKSRRSSKASPLRMNDSATDVVNEADEAMMVEEDDMVPGTQPVDDRVLKDVVAYVEVRSNTENRSRSVAKQLELLGAVVTKKFSNDVTHVIWKEGRKSTKDKAMKKGLHLVSVLWIDSCKQSQEHVAESLYPIHDPTDGSPLVLAKLKRVKSMQPKSLEEELADGGIRKRRKKRKLVAEDFEPLCLQNASPVTRACLQNASPAASRVQFAIGSPASRICFQNNASPVGRLKPRVYVAETQPPMSPLVVGPSFTPTPSLIPNTPDSMRRALEGLSKRREGTPSTPIFTNTVESPTFVPSTPLLKKKMFSAQDDNVSSETDDYKSSDEKDRPTKRQRISSGQNGQRSSASKTKRPRSLENGETSLSADKKNSSIDKGRVVELTKQRKGRRSSMRWESPSLEPIDGGLNVVENMQTDDMVSSRVSELKQDQVKAKKGRRSSMRIQSPSLEPIDSELNIVENMQTDEVTSSRVSELKQDQVKARKGRRSSVRRQSPSLEPIYGLNVVENMQTNEVIFNRVSELMKDQVKAKKGRRSSVRFNLSHEEVKETSENKTENNNTANVTEVPNNRLSVLSGDCAKKGRRSSRRMSTKKSMEECKDTSEEIQIISTNNVNKSVGTSNSNNQSTSETSTSSEISVGNSKKNADEKTEVATSTLVKKKGKKRRLMSLSSQSELSEDLIVPSQSSSNGSHTIQGVDPFMFPILAEEGQSNKQTRGMQKSLVSSRKRKNLVSSSESENEPPYGSSQSSTSSLNITLIPPNRKSLEEFKPSTTKKKKTVPASQTKRRKTNPLRDVNHLLSESEEDHKRSQTGVTGRTANTKGSGRRKLIADSATSTDSDSADSTVSSTKSKRNGKIASQSVRKTKKVKPSLVMTSMHASDQELVLSVAKGLKHFKMVDTVCDSTTHVVVGDNRRTLNVLSAIARGCWLLSMEWVLNSVEAGYWLPEEPYEVHDVFPAAKISRLERAETGDSYKQDLFAPPGSLYISDDSCPPKERLVELVQLCGGLVADRPSDAILCVGKVKCQTDVPIVAELWVLDCITQHTQLPLEPYFFNG